MGVLFDYFAAPTDAQAAATIDWVGGPSNPPISIHPGKRGLFGRRIKGAEDRPSGFRTVRDTGVDPVVKAGTLEALLTGRTFEEILAGSPERPVAIRDEGQQLVLRVSEGLVDALARSAPESLADVAVPWSQTEEFRGQGDAHILGDLLVDLADLARYARSHGEAVYGWVSV
jgi:hypothetical protein